MLIDFHCHILPPRFGERHAELTARDATYATLFPGGPGRIADAEILLRDMDTAGIDRAVVMGFGWTDPAVATEVNDYLISASLTHPDRLTAFASVNPAWGRPAVVEAIRCLEAGATGIGEIHADSQGFDITDVAVMEPLMTVLEPRGRPIVVHASEPVGHTYPGKGRTTPDKLLKFAAGFTRNRIVLAHLGGGLPFYAAMPEVAEQLKNVWYDTAALPYLYRPSAVAAVTATAGADRVLFGTDYPLLSHQRVLDVVRSASLEQADLSAILGDNAATLLRDCN